MKEAKALIFLSGLMVVLAACGRSNLELNSTSVLGETGGASGFSGSAGVSGNGAAGIAVGGGNGEGGGPQGPGGGPQGPGGGPQCNDATDCEDGDFCTLEQCVANKCVFNPRDVDNDQQIDAVCGGTDCNDGDSTVKAGVNEICADGKDNNCDGLADCEDPECAGLPVCSCLDPGGVEICNNGVDDNCDNLTDCEDPKCFGTDTCQCSPFEDCFDGKDNNCNGLIDCGDPNCFGIPKCTMCATKETNCSDTFDEDCDGKTDCADSDCANLPACACGPVELCSNGKDDNCDGKIDCADPTCANTPACKCLPSETSCGDGKDDDCDGKVDCNDSDCFSNMLCTCNALPEICNDGKDNNCNNLIDCADPSCIQTTACKCPQPPSAENCSDKIDNDCDGLVDCADPNCIANPACKQCKPEVCNDGIDNDCDNLIDCADSACAFSPDCMVSIELCNNKIDDDFDTKIDCADEDCKTNPVCKEKQQNCLTAKLITESGTYTGDTTGNIGESKGSCGGDAGEAVFQLVITAPTHVVLDTDGSQFDTTLYLRKGACQAGKELACSDDFKMSSLPPPAWPAVALLDIPILYPGTYFVFLDGYTVDQVSGPNQGPFALNVQLTPNPPEVCNDGIDNDGDIFVDCADPQCAMAANCQCNAPALAGPEYGVGACTDGIDNDCDGKVDKADKDCNASDYYDTEFCNGVDDNGNQIVDDFSCRCASNATCNGGQICYTQSALACGPPCNQFVGDVCPFVAPGSVCNAQTGQCAFP
jgi:hypothetical protein